MQTCNYENGKIMLGDVLQCAEKIESSSVNCVITSPPYWQLRDYGYPEQWGLEPTYKEYLAHLQSLMKEIWRVLKPDGTVWINLGDTYSNANSNIKDKSLMLIPHRFAIDCIDNGWILRNDVIWAKPNGMPESVTDRFTKKHEFMFFFVKQQKYYFDLDSVREKHKETSGWAKQRANGVNTWENSTKKHIEGLNGKETANNPLGKNCGDVSDFWAISTKPTTNEHYASYNLDLIKKPILAGCPPNGLIYDPFMGTATTAVAAMKYGRKFIGSEGSPDYVAIADKNIRQTEKEVALQRLQTNIF